MGDNWYEVGVYYGRSRYLTLGRFATPLQAIRAARRLFRSLSRRGSGLWDLNLTACRRGGGSIVDMDWIGQQTDRRSFIGVDGRGW